MTFKALPKKKIKEIFKKIAGEGKRAELISGDWKGPYAVAAVVVENVKGAAEVHEHSADIWHVVSGSAVFTLGGKLNKAEEKSEGEFVSEQIVGGQNKTVSVGDVLDISPGTPHQINAVGSKIELMIVKVNKL